MIRLGIDNGEKGGIVGINANFEAPIVEPMPWLKKEGMNERRVLAILQRAIEISGGNIYAVLEYAQAFPKAGAVGMFHYGASYGGMKGMLMALMIPFQIVKPKVWQADVGIVTRYKPKMIRGITALHRKTGKALTEPDRAALKAQSIAVCQRRLPGLNLIPKGCSVEQDGLADAANMALHAANLRPGHGLVIPRRKAPPPPPMRR